MHRRRSLSEASDMFKATPDEDEDHEEVEKRKVPWTRVFAKEVYLL